MQINYFKYGLIALLAVVFSWEIHEGAHWLAGTLLGHKMIMGLNTVYPVRGSYNNTVHEMLVSAAGPFVTLLQALAVFWILRKNHSIFWFPFLFTCFYMRLLAMCISVINPNDEARISQYLGMGKFTLPFIVTALLFGMLYKIIRQCKPGALLIAATILLVMIFSSVLILSDRFIAR